MCEGKTEQREGPRGSGSGVILLPAEPVLAGAVGKGKGHPAARGDVLGFVFV